MQRAVLVRLRPAGPWRFGPGDGGDTRLDFTFRSDRLYSAITISMGKLGWLEEWLDATARGAVPAVTLTSLLPFQGDVLFAPPPASLWPPPPSLVVSPNPVFLSKLRWTTAQFVPVNLIEAILLGQPILADQWIPDSESGCLLRRDRPSSSPFRTQIRTSAAVDRLANGSVKVTSQACVEFESGSGLWGMIAYTDRNAESTWSTRLEAACRLLADSGFGARRSSGWGQTEVPDFQRGEWPRILFPKLAPHGAEPATPSMGGSESTLYWLLSLYIPNSSDVIDWTAGDYKLVRRGGRIENGASSGTGKKLVNMVVEGSVLSCEKQPLGAAVDVAPDGFAHPVYRYGFAFSMRLPVMGPEAPQFVEAPPGEALGGPGEELPPCQPESPKPSEPEPERDEIETTTKDSEAGAISEQVELEPATEDSEVQPERQQEDPTHEL